MSVISEDVRMKVLIVRHIHFCACWQIWCRECRINCCIWMRIFCFREISGCCMTRMCHTWNMPRQGIIMASSWSLRIILMRGYCCLIWKISEQPVCLWKHESCFRQKNSFLRIKARLFAVRVRKCCSHRNLMIRNFYINILSWDIFPDGCFICRIRIRTTSNNGR